MNRPHPALSAAAGLLAAASFATAGVACTGPASGTEAAVQAAPGIDSVRLLTALSVLAHDSMEGRRTGTAGGARARSYLVRELTALGIEPVGPGYEHPFEAAHGGTAVNLLGKVNGSESGPWLVLSAHYDHEGVRNGAVYNGADDNASGVATVLEIARVLKAAPPRHPVLVALFDAEEEGLLGAEAFVEHPPVALAEIGLDVNLDMVARTAGLLWAGGSYQTPALRPILEAVSAEAAVELRLGHDRPNAPEGDDWTHQSDQGPFDDLGIPFVYFGVEDHPDYHRPTDDYERVDPGEFVRSARTILKAVRALDAALPLSSPESPR